MLQTTPGTVVFRSHARDLHLVFSPARQCASESSWMEPLREKITGVTPTRMALGKLENTLYQLIREEGAVEDRTLEIEFLDPGVQAFAFTFG